ncbi:hypothetical protein chiPu_0027678 [Chiloscyllium punctatum]|uniref:Uncharacterized protein n=1 Tax=Chiloscyllium punctatum TaxID=137246 RepID=A0A401TMJ1_CHIPU|nr:hypothetical protein [Chiloscyllium punctatum]
MNPHLSPHPPPAERQDSGRSARNCSAPAATRRHHVTEGGCKREGERPEPETNNTERRSRQRLGWAGRDPNRKLTRCRAPPPLPSSGRRTRTRTHGEGHVGDERDQKRKSRGKGSTGRERV